MPHFLAMMVRAPRAVDLVAKSAVHQAATCRAAKREQRVFATGMPAHQSASHATGFIGYCRRVFRAQHGRKPSRGRVRIITAAPEHALSQRREQGHP